MPFATADDAIEHEFILEDTIAIMRCGVEGLEAFLNYCDKSAIRKVIIDTTNQRLDWERTILKFNLSDQNLSGKVMILATSQERDLAATICCSVKALLEAVAKREKEFGEVDNKVRVTDSESAQQAWRRMLLTIEGLNEAELAAVIPILPDLGSAIEKLNLNEGTGSEMK